MTSSSRGALAAAIIGSAIVFLDGTIVNIALPRIGATLPAVAIGVLEGQVYIVAGYMATLAAFLLLAGALGDRYGRRRIFLLGLVGFGVASLICALAPSLDVLAAARLLQGVAGALLVPGSLAIITATFEGPARGRAFGIWAASTSVLTIFGPPVGGTLVEVFGWQSIFLVNAPLVVLGVFLTLRYVPELRATTNRTRFDWLGAMVAAVAVGGLSFGAIRGQQVAWAEPLPLVLLGVGLVAVIVFPILMVRRRDPLVPPDDVPEPDLRRDQCLDGPDLRCALCPALHAEPVPAGRARVLAAGGCAGRSADGHCAGAHLDLGWHARRAARREAVPCGWARGDGRGRPVVAQGSERLDPVAGPGQRSIVARSAARGVHRSPAGDRSCSASGSRSSWRP